MTSSELVQQLVSKMPLFTIKIAKKTTTKQYKWIEKKFYPLYVEWQRIQNLLPESMWKHYENMGVSDMPEQIALDEARRLMNITWKDRPAFMKEFKHGTSKPKATKEGAENRDSDKSKDGGNGVPI